jgi:hypothetical protein
VDRASLASVIEKVRGNDEGSIDNMIHVLRQLRPVARDENGVKELRRESLGAVVDGEAESGDFCSKFNVSNGYVTACRTGPARRERKGTTSKGP